MPGSGLEKREALPAPLLERRPKTCLGAPFFPDRPETGPLLAPSGEGRLVCSEKLCAPGTGISAPSYEEFRSPENSECACVSIGPAPSLALRTTMKNQDKKNGTAKQSGNSSNPKNNPGQAEAGPEGTQGRPSQLAPATEGEGSSSQAPGKTEGVCPLWFPAGRGRSLRCNWVASGVRGFCCCLPRKEEP